MKNTFWKMNYIKKSLIASLVDAIVVSIFASVFAPKEHITVFISVFLPLFVSFFILSLVIAKSSKKEPISIFLYPFSKTDDFATLKTPFILSLITYIVLFYLLLILLFDRLTVPLRIVFLQEIIFLISFLIIMRIGLIFITRPETSTKGGIILLTTIGSGTIGILLPIVMFGDIIVAPQLFFVAMLSCIVIVISGCLGIREGEKYYANEILKIKGEIKIHSNAPFVIPIVSLGLVVILVVSFFTLILGTPLGCGWELLYFVFFFVFPLGVISIILNMIGMFEIRKEIDPRKKLIEKILITIPWCLIVFILVCLLIS